MSRGWKRWRGLFVATRRIGHAAVLLSADGWTGGRIARAFGVTPDSVRRWRTWRNRLVCAGFMAEGVAGLRANPQAGSAPVRSEAALALARAVLSGPVTDRPNWTLPRLQAELAARDDGVVPQAQLGKTLKGGFRWRRPRHGLHGRSWQFRGRQPVECRRRGQDAQAAERFGLRLRLLRQHAAAGGIVLFGDGPEALTHPCLAPAWAKRGADLRVPAPGQARRRALPGVLDHGRGELSVHVSASKRSTDFIALLDILDVRCGPKPGGPKPGRAAAPVVSAQTAGFALVPDHGPIRTSRLTRAAPAERAWLAVERLPKHAPELNDIERSWRDLKRRFPVHRTVPSVEHPGCAITHATIELNRERSRQTCRNQRTAA